MFYYRHGGFVLIMFYPRKFLLKQADTELLPHQQRVIDRLFEKGRKGIIAQHSMGSGKTLTALRALEKYHNDTGKEGLFIVPASLQDNVLKEVAKHKIGYSPSVLSYEKAVRELEELQNSKPGMVVFDESHRLRNSDTKRVRGLKTLIDNSDKTLLLTGTAGYNHPSDMLGLVHLLDEKIKSPKSQAEFENKYVKGLGTYKLTDRARKELAKPLKQYLDVYKTPTDTIDFPTTYSETIQIPMSDKQMRVYRLAENKLPLHLRHSVRSNLPLSLKESNDLNVFATGIRQASVGPMHHDITAHPEDSAKLMSALEHAKNFSQDIPGFRGVAYSNYIDAGLNPYNSLLQKSDIKPLLFTGALNKKQKKALIDEYNTQDDTKKMLLLSSSGAEGLDLKRTRLMQILEPHFNKAKIDQVVARGARYKSHADLPEMDRNMKVEYYQSTMPKKWYHKVFGLKPDSAIDGYLQNISENKQKLIDEMVNL